MAIGENIRIAREKCGLSQERLAELLNVSQVLIYKYENEMCQPNATTAVSIAERLGTTVEKLVKGG